ncbi:MAG: hypothetical protein CMP10_15925 [Zetaproteobacteria bacterium]|nr:hypothetical protein [Pseudobdellovibrionaceae bacterium]
MRPMVVLVGVSMAYSTEERNKKKRCIVGAASEIFTEREYRDVSMRQIAEIANMGKATLYNFFDSKEEIFIEIYKVELELWLEEVLDIFSQQLSLQETIELLVSKHCKRKKFNKLMPLLNTVLEISLNADFLRKFKSYLLNKVVYLDTEISKLSPYLKDGDFGPFIIHYTAHFNGLYLMEQRSATLERILEQDSSLEIFATDLETEMKKYLMIYFSYINKEYQNEL